MLSKFAFKQLMCIILCSVGSLDVTSDPTLRTLPLKLSPKVAKPALLVV